MPKEIYQVYVDGELAQLSGDPVHFALKELAAFLDQSPEVKKQISEAKGIHFTVAVSDEDTLTGEVGRDPYQEGRDAYSDDKDLSDNPYLGGEKARNWADGWEYAARNDPLADRNYQ